MILCRSTRSSLYGNKECTKLLHSLIDFEETLKDIFLPNNNAIILISESNHKRRIKIEIFRIERFFLFWKIYCDTYNLILIIVDIWIFVKFLNFWIFFFLRLFFILMNFFSFLFLYRIFSKRFFSQIIYLFLEYFSPFLCKAFFLFSKAYFIYLSFVIFFSFLLKRIFSC